MKDLVTKLLQAKAAAGLSLDGWDPRTATSAAIAKREAGDRLPRLRDEYRQEVQARLVKVFVYGAPERVKAMADYLDDQGAVVVDGQHLYNLLAAPVESTIDPRARRLDSHQTLRLRQEYLDVSRLLELADVPELKTAQQDYDALVKTPEETLAACKKIVRRTTGDALNQVYLEKKIIGDTPLTPRSRPPIFPSSSRAATRKKSDTSGCPCSRGSRHCSTRPMMSSTSRPSGTNSVKKWLKS